MDYQTWHEAVTKCSMDAMNYLNSSSADNPAIVLDIDETILDENMKVIEPVYNVYLLAVNLGISVFFVTSRLATEPNIRYTHMQLQYNGITRYRCIYFKSNPFIDDELYKKTSREDIHRSMNCTVILSIGDMPWDIGEYGGYGIKLPSKV